MYFVFWGKGFRRARIIGVFILSFMLAACGKNKVTELYNALPINTDGNPTGRVVLVEFLDYSNPACLKMAPILNEVMEKRPNVRIIYHPIVLNPSTAYFTELVLSAGLQDRFLAAHHLMINASSKLTEKQTITLLSQAFIDPQQLVQQEKGGEVTEQLTKNQALAKAWEVATVPVFFVGRLNHQPMKLEGSQTLAQLLSAIDKENSK